MVFWNICLIYSTKSDIRKLENCLKQSTTLLLLDGFDENPSCIEFISKLTVNNGYQCTVVISSRGSHADQTEAKIWDMRLMVKGFKEEAIYRFFELQNCAKPNEIFDSYSQLPEMCKVPMIAAILCSICQPQRRIHGAYKRRKLCIIHHF